MTKQNKKYKRTAYDRVIQLFDAANDDTISVDADVASAYYIEAIAYMLFKLYKQKLKKLEY